MTHQYNTRNKVNYPVNNDDAFNQLSLYGGYFCYDEDGLVYENHLAEVGRISDDRNNIIWDLQKLVWAKMNRLDEGNSNHDDLNHIIYENYPDALPR